MVKRIYSGTAKPFSVTPTEIGAVTTVNGINADSNGNVSLKASNISTNADGSIQEFIDIEKQERIDSNTLMQAHIQATGNPHNTQISDISNLSTTLDSKWGKTQLLRKKTEISWSGINVAIPTTATNLISFLKNLTGTITGSFAPFADAVNNKLVFNNTNRDILIKFSCQGTWSGSATQPRSLQIDYPLAVPDSIKALRDTSVTVDRLTLTEFIGLDKDGATALNGLSPTINSNNGTLTITACKLVITQYSE